MNNDYVLYLVAPGDRPPYYRVADHLWGAGADVDSDGDSRGPEDTQWTELSLRLRDGTSEAEIHVDPRSTAPLVLRVRSPDKKLTQQVAVYLSEQCRGAIVEERPSDER